MDPDRSTDITHDGADARLKLDEYGAEIAVRNVDGLVSIHIEDGDQRAKFYVHTSSLDAFITQLVAMHLAGPRDGER